MYAMLFHVLGGDTRLTGVEIGDTDAIYVRSCLRTLFLMSKQVRADLWETPMFEEELKKATAHLDASSAVYKQTQACIRKLRARVLDPRTATIKIDLALRNPSSLGTRTSCVRSKTHAAAAVSSNLPFTFENLLMCVWPFLIVSVPSS